MASKPDFSVKGALFPPIHKEGVFFGLVAVVLSLVVPSLLGLFLAILGLKGAASFCAGLTSVLLVLSYGVFLFFRDPERFPPENAPGAILSPADGRVCLLRKIALPPQIACDTTEVWCVSIFMSVTNVHINRAPFAAKVIKKVHIQGKFLNASLDKASEDNERCLYMMETASGKHFGVVQIAGFVARRIVPFVDVGDSLERAERFGLIRFGSRLDVYLPAGVEPRVSLGQTMTAGETILAYIEESDAV